MGGENAAADDATATTEAAAAAAATTTTAASEEKGEPVTPEAGADEEAADAARARKEEEGRSVPPASEEGQVLELEFEQGGEREGGWEAAAAAAAENEGGGNFEDELDDAAVAEGASVPPPANPLSCSLATSPNTPLWAKILLPLLCLSCHVVFYYGQTAPMWKLKMFADIDAWANATDFTSRTAFDTVGLPHENNFRVSEDQDVETFTYYYAIDHLWVAKGLPGKALPRAAAILLVVFSGFWPHIKLLMLNLTWFCGKYPTRTKHLQWLSTLGKWSLADVLVVCVMVGVLHLDWIVVPADIKQGLVTDLPQIIGVVKSIYPHRALCDKLLKLQCGHEKNLIKITKCHACWTLVDEAYNRPEWARSTGETILKGVNTSGGGLATLRVVGMSGIYAFSAAVILSILLSFVIDVFDHKAKLNGLKDPQSLVAPGHRRDQRQRHDLALAEERGPLGEPLLLDSNEPEPLEVDLGDLDSVVARRSPRNLQDAVFALVFFLLTSLTAILTFYGIDVDSMERQVKGAGPMILHDILGVDWDTDYSLRTLMWTTGAAGSWDYLLMGTFGLFIALGPAVRAVLLETVALFHHCRRPASVLSTLIKFVGPFCAWEVFGIAIVMTQLLMPMITNTIIDNPACGSVSEDGSCLQVEFNILTTPFGVLVLGWFLLSNLSNLVVNRAASAEDAATWMLLSESQQQQQQQRAPGGAYQLLPGGAEGNEEAEGPAERVARIVQV